MSLTKDDMEKQQQNVEKMDVDPPKKADATGKPEVSQPEASKSDEMDRPKKRDQHGNSTSCHNQQLQDEINNPTYEGSQDISQVHDLDEYSRGHDHTHGDGAEYQQNMQYQQLEQVFRDAQASKKMVYGVYENCIAMLEEIESRELKKTGREALPRSEIDLFDQSKFDDDTVETKFRNQLGILKLQLVACHDEIKDEVNEEMKKFTIHWISLREAKTLPFEKTDEYAQNLFKLLVTGTTADSKEFDETPNIGERDIGKAVEAIAWGQQMRTDLDKSFRDDPKLKAIPPKMRETAGIDIGADRMVKNRPEFEEVVNSFRDSLL